METATQRGGRGRPSPNAASGCRFPNRRIERSVALSETCTRHAPPSYSFPSVITLGFDSRVGNLLSRSCRARRRCRKQGGTPRRDPALAWATRGTGATWPLLPLRSPDVSQTSSAYALASSTLNPPSVCTSESNYSTFVHHSPRRENKKEDEREKPHS
jgi:hypothetical protein